MASGYSATFPVTAITSVSPAVATVGAGHGAIVGTVMEMTSGWSALNNKVVRVSAVSVNDLTLDSYDASSLTTYPTGVGVGSMREITGWTQIPQILGSAFSGGDQNFFEYQYLESDSKVKIPTVKNAAELKLTIADDPTLAGIILAGVANNDRAQRSIKVQLANGGLLYYTAYVSLRTTPSLTINVAMEVEITLAFLNVPVRY